MKNGMKRTISLLLSAVLLLSNVPVGAWAEEDPAAQSQSEETQQPETQSPETNSAEPQQSAQEQTLGNPVEQTIVEESQQYSQSVMATENETPITPNITVNGNPITDQNMADILGDQKVSYSEGKLTLNRASIQSISANGSLIIELKGENTISGTDEVVKVCGALTIRGDGSLAASSSGTTVVSVAGTVEEENKKGLTIQGNAQVSVESTYSGEGTAVGIDSANGVVICDAAHFKTTHTGASQDYQVCAGYVKKGANEFVQQSEGTIKTEGGALEFISASHLTQTYVDEKNHALSCQKVDGNNCALVQSGINTEEHKESTAAGCGLAAKCNVCDSYYGEADDKHKGDLAYVETNSGEKHVQKYSECRHTVGEELDHVPWYQLSEDKDAVIGRCKGCGAELDSFTVKPPTASGDQSLIWDNTAKGIIIDPEDTEYQYSVLYYKDSVPEDRTGGSTTKPSEVGIYVAVATVEIGRETFYPQVSFTIAKKSLEGMTIGVESNGEIVGISPKEYSGTSHKVTGIVVADDGDTIGSENYTISYARKAANSDTYTEITQSNDFVDAGTIQVTATAKEESNYTGSVSTTYIINKAEVPEDAYAPDLSNNTAEYDGTAKTVGYTSNNKYSVYGIGTPKVVFYQNNEKVSPIDAGTYEVRVEVEESENYKSATLIGEWVFTIESTSQYKESTEKTNQTIGNGVGTFVPPSFTGHIREGSTEPEKVSGTTQYTYNNSNTTSELSELESYLDGLSGGTTETISYTFTPEKNGNYKGIKTGAIHVAKILISFTMDDNTAVSPEKVKKTSTITYGDKDIVDVSKLVAKVGSATDTEDTHFTVKYAMEKAGGGYDTDNLLPEPNAGSCKFFIYYNSSNLGGQAFENVKVTEGSIYVAKKVPDEKDLKTPTAKELTESRGEVKELQELIVAGSDGETPLEYSLAENGEYSTTIPKAAEAGVYTVYYRSPLNANYTTDIKGSVNVVVLPYLTATYGETLAEVESGISTENGTWKFNTNNGDINETKVGAVNETGNTFKIDFYPKGTSAATVTDKDVKIYVEPAHIRLDVTLQDKYLPYDSGEKVEAKVTVKIAGTDTDFDKSEYSTLCTNITNSSDTEVINPGKAQIEVLSRGNYVIDNAEDVIKEYIVYNYAVLKLTDTWKYADYGNNYMASAGYATGKEVKARLDKELDETDYPATKRKYSDFVMKDNSQTKYVYEPMYWPDDGLALTVSYPTTDADENDEYRILAMYTVDSGTERTDLNTVAGTVIELVEADGTLGINEYKKTEKGITVKLKNYATVCIALKENEDKEYNITARTNSSSKGTVRFKVGSSTEAKTSSTAKKGETITVTPSAMTGYTLSRLNYTYNDGTNDITTAIDKNSSGKYTFTMPSASVTINAQFDKNVSNPSSGDSSHIYFWAAVLAVSVMGITALILKRKKFTSP